MKIRQAKYVKSAAAPRDYPPADRLEIAFAGRSNAGKSTMLNALCGIRGLAKTSQTPGKTRIINFFDINEDIYFVDLPGYGWAKVAQEERAGWARMIENYLRRRETLAGVVLLIDLRRGPTDLDFQLIEFIRATGKLCIPVFTKADKLKGNERRNQIQRVCRQLGVAPEQALIASGLKKEGIDKVWQRLNEVLQNSSAIAADKNKS